MKNAILAVMLTISLMACGSGASDATNTTGNGDQGNNGGYNPYEPGQPGQKPAPHHTYQGQAGNFNGTYSGQILVTRGAQQSTENFQVSVQQNQNGFSLQTSPVQGFAIRDARFDVRANKIFAGRIQAGEIDQNGFYFRQSNQTSVQFDRWAQNTMHVRISFQDARGAVFLEANFNCP